MSGESPPRNNDRIWECDSCGFSPLGLGVRSAGAAGVLPISWHITQQYRASLWRLQARRQPRNTQDRDTTEAQEHASFRAGHTVYFRRPTAGSCRSVSTTSEKSQSGEKKRVSESHPISMDFMRKSREPPHSHSLW